MPGARTVAPQTHSFEVTSARPLSLMSADGELLSGAHAPMTDDEAVTALRWMVLSRALDLWGTRLQRMGRIGLYTPVHGQEASVVGAAMALDPARDWLVPAYREQPAWLMQGFPLESLMGQYMGKRSAIRIPDGVRMLPRQQAIAAQLPHAVGIAWALRIRRESAAVLVFCGEGATSEGDFHEACNLAGVQRAPVVFVVQNNAWAISTPASKQTAAASIAARGPGYGFPGYVVDGNDVFAVFSTARDAVARARDGSGPTIIECLTYRLSFHNTSDNPNRYRTTEEYDEASRKDPLTRIDRYLRSRGRWDDAAAEQLQREVDERIKSAIAVAEGMPPNTAADLFDDVFASPPERVLRQRDAATGSAEGSR
jgi:pyruvate dehydrogenase E1 component alpha subunit